MDFGEILRRKEAGEITEEEKRALFDEAAIRPIREDDDPSGVVYYIRFCCRIKIGFTKNLRECMYQLPPDEVLATEVGTRDTEWKRHRQFEGARIRGEWFSQSPALLAHVRALKVKHHSAATDNPGERFIPTASAMKWTGRSRQVLYRWANEGRITRYGTEKQALWDIFELPARAAHGPAPAPPAKKS